MTLHVDLALLTLAVGTLLPAVTAFVTHRFATAIVKTAILALLSLLTAAGETAVTNGGDFDAGAFLTTAVVQLILGIAVHYQIMKPAGLTGSAGAIARAVPGGLGEPREPYEV